MKRWALLALSAVLLVAAGGVTPAVAAPAVADDGAKVVSETWVDARTVDLKISSPALGTTGMVRLIVPTGWAAQPSRTWPVLFLLHGCCEPVDYQSWDQFTDVKAFTANKDALVVMPTDGPAGMYTKWWNFGLGATPDWDTFHTAEVRQIVERGYRGGTQRAVAGLSIGGYGALAYAFKHPGMFGAAASYSGVPNTLFPGIPVWIIGILARAGIYNYLQLWGDSFGMRPLWSAANPYDHVDQLRGTALYISCGNGQTGPLDPPGQSDVLEPSALLSSQSFTDLLRAKGIPATVDYYGPGTHSWPYWQRALHNSWPVLAGALGLPA
ncbi:alpha/beta hydrolase family protein [Amycolatopsis sp. SID8362]|uniref:alpha/beta hydrolase n=1 Tax=Amycolatopsis sp. SID8362 TaxID=2690346 RepID=UPI001369F59F|nr:alpha/beta hydrolase family protein [Amycolatopsis sp. SID8362]NBH06280.1 esterase family protein [Amycolatopsis sp. SID8362]NED42979.1 esterase family protein [Amycolatopsis sp. SID8362]